MPIKSPPQDRPLLLCGTILPPSVAGLFAERFRVVACPVHAMPDRAAAAGASALLVAPGGDPCDRRLIEALPDRISAIATYSVGLDHIDTGAAAERGIAVLNTPDVLADSVADAAMLLLLGAARRVTESVALVRGGRWGGWTPTQLNGVELRGKLLGIVGFGGIGQRTARRAAAFGMTIAYHGRRRAEDEQGARYQPDLDVLVAEADALLLCCPLTDATHHMLDARRLRLARSSLIVVNVGRGDLVDDDALIDALAEKRILAAGLDVFSGEPAIDARYFDLPNLFALPHIGSSTVEARMAMGRALADGLDAWLHAAPA